MPGCEEGYVDILKEDRKDSEAGCISDGKMQRNPQKRLNVI